MKLNKLTKKMTLWIAELPFLKKYMHNQGYQSTASRFVAGKNLDESIVKVKELRTRGFEVTLDLLGESVTTEYEAKSACVQIAVMMNELKKHDISAYISLKLTQLGLCVNEGLCERNMRKLVTIAKQNHQFIRIDMEDASVTEKTLQLFYRLVEEFGTEHIGIVVQSCLFRTRKDLETLIELNANVRVVKGAYLEPKEVAYSKKSAVDQAYVDAVKSLLSSGNYAAIATHDEKIIFELIDFIHKHHIPSTQFEFQMLYGIATKLQHELLQNGFCVRVYTPYGEHWYPYFTRRLAERPANVWFVMKNFIR